jgi:hypothetical protein
LNTTDPISTANFSERFSISTLSRISSNCSTTVSGQFYDVIDSIGQSRLLLETVENPISSDLDYFYAMGLAEGYLTARRIIHQLHNVVWTAPDNGEFVDSFLSSQHSFMQAKAGSLWRSDSYWFQVQLELIRLDGILDGLRSRQRDQIAVNREKRPSPGSDDGIWPYYETKLSELYKLNSNAEFDEISASGDIDLPDLRLPEFEMAELSRCSALVKLIEGSNRREADLIAAHNTWTTYSEMLRIYKSFSFEHVVDSSFSNKRLSMASYPGYLSSMDDWLTLSDQRLLVTETTNECISRSTLRKHVEWESVSTMIRSLVASKMASSGKEWFEFFTPFNSGTYNNQWIIIDYSKFSEWKSGSPPEGILWVGEQAPGLVLYDDMTHYLFKKKYWASYNRPYFTEIAKTCGYASASLERGEWYLHDKCPRARMFKALHGGVYNIESMKAVMTLNDWKATHSCPKNQIAARYDIDGHFEKNSIDFKKCGPASSFGAIDCKIVNSKMMENNEVWMSSGPLWNNTVEAFSWSDSSDKAAHWGHPSVWNFSFVKWRADSVEWEPDSTQMPYIPLPIVASLPESIISEI